MKKLLVLTSALLVLSASIASAQGINLAWRNCIAVTSGALSAQANVTYACDASATGPFRLVSSFFAPANLNHFVGIQAVLDIQTADATLPDFWKLGVGECREGAFGFPIPLLNVGNTTTCRNPWAGGQTGGGYTYLTGFESPARARVLLAFARDTETSLTLGQQYIATMSSLDMFKDTDVGDGECVGCAVPACLVLNSVELFQTAGQTPPDQDIYVMNTQATRRYVTWQGGAVPGGGCPAATPTRNATWGSVKSLYR
jgi:hypothetical protein